MNKKIFKTIIFSFLFLNLISSKNSLFIEKNPFFNRIFNGLNLNQESNIGSLYLKEFYVFFEELSFYKLKLNKISSSDIENILLKIDKIEKKFLNSSNLISQTDKDKVIFIADYLRNGIALELLNEHLAYFREYLIFYLDNISFLIDYWNKDLSTQTYLEKFGEFFGRDIDRRDSRLKLISLTVLKDRVATYLGKVDCIIQDLKELRKKDFIFNQNYNFKKNYKQEDIYKELNTGIREAVFCINSYFVENFDPDDEDYAKSLKTFMDISFSQAVGLISKNHINIQLMDENFEYQIKNYEVPTFIQRHWLSLSLVGVTGMGLGIYAYLNWDKLTSDDPASLKMRINKIKKSAKDSFFDSYNFLKNKFFSSGAQGQEGLNEIVNLFKKNYGDLFNKLVQQGVFIKSEQQDASGEQLTINQNYTKELDLILGRLDRETAVIQGNNQELQEEIATFKEHKNQFLAHFRAILKEFGNDVEGEVAEPVPAVAPAPAPAKTGVVGKTFSFMGKGLGLVKTGVGKGAGFVLKKAAQTTTLGESTIELNDALRKIKEKGFVSPCANNLTFIVDDLSGMLDSLSPQLSSAGVCGQLGLLIFYNLVIKSMVQVNESIKTAQSTLNWVKAIFPIMVISTISFILIRNAIKAHHEKFYENINSIIRQIYRILNNYSSNTVDYYYYELKYKDQGLISYWLERLKLTVKKANFKEKDRMLRLIEDLQNPDINVLQKIEFINLECKNLL